jgi:predicted nucleotidyltransferase
VSKLQAIIQRKDKRRLDLQSALASIVDQLRQMGALRIVLFGSLATGEVDVNSDIDLLVIMPDTESGKVWWRVIYDKVERGIASDLIVLNKTEFQQEFPINTFLRTIIKKGETIYEKTATGRSIEMAHTGRRRVRGRR